MDSKIVSMNTRKQLGKQDTKANDKLASEGKYIGCLPKYEADFMRVWQDRLIVEEQKINELVAAFEEDYKGYMSNVVCMLLYFKIDPSTFNPETDQLMIGTDGNVWIAKKGGE